MTVSVIMPVYNSEEYLGTAIESVLNQTYQDLELVIVDDESTDSSYEICKEYAKKDNRIVLLRKSNGGSCSARNYGLKHAKGQYIAFCDNDDYMLPTALEDNVLLAEKHRADMVKWNYYTYVDGKKQGEQALIEGLYITRRELVENYANFRLSAAAVWNGLFRRDFIINNNIEFNEAMRYGGEDLNFTLQMVLSNARIFINPKSYYVWVLRNSHSVSGKRNKNFCDTMIKNARIEFDILLSQWNYGEKYWDDIWKGYVEWILPYAECISKKMFRKYKFLFKIESIRYSILKRMV